MKPEAKLPEVANTSVGAEFNLDSSNYQKIEKAGDTSVVESSAERVEQVAEMQAVASDLSAGVQLSPTMINDNYNSATAIVNSQKSPLTAEDDDLIEKEWVDRAKKIVNDTQNNPHGREDQVGDLRVDYIKKRWGRDLGAAE